MDSNLSCQDKTVANAVASSNTKHMFHFKWQQEIPRYANKMLQRLNEFRKMNMHCDLLLKACDAELTAHKVVLAACGGIFRKGCIEEETDTIGVTKISLNCNALGLEVILKFAYSGILDIDHANILPTLIAAAATEMKEIEEVCSEIALSKLGWLLEFGGAEELIPVSRKYTASFTAQESHDALHQLLLIQPPNLTALTFKYSSEQDATTTNDENDEKPQVYPYLKQVGRSWPELKDMYISVVKCLLRAENMTTRGKKNVKTEHDQAAPVNSHESRLSDENIEKSSNAIAEEKSSNAIAEDKTKKSTDEHKHSLSGKEINSASPIDSEKQHSAPKTRATSISTQITASPCSTEDSQSTQRKHAKSSPPLPLPPTSPVSVSPIPHGRKHPGTKPPPVPKSPFKKSVSSAEESSKPTSSSTSKTTPSKNGTKIPPPRPKPPSVSKKTKPKKDSTNPLYDDTLNPFAH